MSSARLEALFDWVIPPISTYLKAYDSMSAERADIADYISWYNAHRPHSSLERLTPDEIYLTTLPFKRQAA